MTTRNLVRGVKRNIDRFPEDFMFQLSKEEFLRRQIGASSGGHGGRRYLPYAFTEHGVAMLSRILRSEKAILINIEIMRVFLRMRHILASHKELEKKLEELECVVHDHDQKFEEVFDAIRQMINPPVKPKPRIGFHTGGA